MRRLLIFALSAAVLSSCCGGGSFTWERTIMNGSRTGVQACSASDVPQKLGVVDDSLYVAPNGREFANNTSTYAAAKALLAVQDKMADLKTVIGYSPRAMVRTSPESEIGDWFIDHLMEATQEKAHRKVHFGITNFGGIRVDMPEGEVLKDDIVSMFPFKNHLCYLELYGRDIRALLEQLAATSWQAVGGARCVVKDGKLVSAEIDGAPLDDNRVYGVATISFLLNGGDGISVARNVKKLVEFKDVMIIDVMLPYVKQLTAEGKNVEYSKDGRIQIIKSENNN